MVYAPGQTRGIAKNIWGPYAAALPNGFESNGRKGLILIPRILQVCFWSHKVCLPSFLFEGRIQGTQPPYTLDRDLSGEDAWFGESSAVSLVEL